MRHTGRGNKSFHFESLGSNKQAVTGNVKEKARKNFFLYRFRENYISKGDVNISIAYFCGILQTIMC